MLVDLGPGDPRWERALPVLQEPRRAALFRALVERGRELGCRRIDLDSGVRRHAARRFYPRERMDIDAHHFSRSLG